jgi:hypothetical protein
MKSMGGLRFILRFHDPPEAEVSFREQFNAKSEVLDGIS